ncbi:HD domain-containing protein [Methylobacterium sp. WL30]|uniref:HD-GYP domain-containing protein n=3 Tax=Methylobacterium TaxID=407 RepID=UPI0011C7639F|nr:MULTISPECIES: HD domain-containing phosphohydrolase [unclassified Methylobacterium]MCJ2079148.1 HD domain-containing protein [Methylobacterium sp. E-016]TXN44496.1 HD domain-containing protein [Methylobacterium sp. WL119]TXN63140.1 HD domain-containing protein [Methylobacterium sp. WL30]
MKTILVLTDQPERGRRLAGQLRPLGEPLVIDLLDPYQSRNAPDLSQVVAVVGDASLAHSQQVSGLHRYMHRLGPGRVPFLCVLHEDTPRAHLQAQALGATRTLRADAVLRELVPALRAVVPAPSVDAPAPSPAPDAALPSAPPSAPDGGRTAVRAAIAEADTALTRIFDLGRAGRAPAPAMAAAGADLVVGALNKADIRGWLDVVWRFDDATHQHCLLVAGLAAGFARQLGLRTQDCRDLTQAALLHDLGKARIPLAILNKPARLDEAEMAVMRTHPVLGIEMLQGQDYPAAMLAVVRSHHEALDGSGYPDGLTARQIPDLVRLITVCDIYGALIERRPYKRPLSGEAAYDLLRGMTGKVDPDLVNAFKPIAEAVGSTIASASAA